jgi:tripartite-type tricarboxylate transporter receptor subunit TctC
MFKKSLIMVWVILSLGIVFVPCSYAADYPARPVEFMVGFAPGGPADLGARVVAEVAKKYLGQPLVVVNKPGAGSTIAVADVVGAKPDGYKIIFLSDSYLGTAIHTQKIPFNPNQLSPLVNFMGVKMGLAVRSDSKWTSLKQLLDDARQKPGTIKWNNPNRGTLPHINALIVLKKAGVEMTELFYKGTPEQMAALLGGHVDVSAISFATAWDQIRAGKLRVLATLSDHRYPEIPDVPSVVELGYKDQIVPYYSTYVHKDTPEPIKKQLIEVFKKTFDDPDLKKGMAKIGEDLKFGGPELIGQNIKRIEEIGVPILKEIGLYVENK